MKTPPAWKLKRELKRLFKQMLRVAPNTWEYLTLTWHYDYVLSRDRKHHQGEKSIAAEVAIYLIFPKNGVLKSHFQMLEVLNQEGIVPVLVSNQPLSPHDLEQLKSYCAVIIERPNVGYDFGGYRDAILELSTHLPELDRLYILNDSVWMIDADKSWFQEVRETDKDFCGATSNYGILRYSDVNFQDVAWEYTSDHWNFHYASYALGVGKKILRDSNFLKYWKRFRLSNNKKRTVRRGEIGLSKWVKDNGYTHAATCDVYGLDQEIKNLEPEVLDQVARHLIIPEAPRLLEKRNEVLESQLYSPEGISDRVSIILTAVSGQAMGYVMPYYSFNFRDFQFIKKSPLWLSKDASSLTLRILESLDGPLGRQACLEAHQIVEQSERRSKTTLDGA